MRINCVFHRFFLVLTDPEKTLRVKFDPEDVRDNAPTISIERPSVYIIYYPDDIYHKNVVRHFADFLNRVGRCDVRIDIQDAESIMQLSKPTYVVQQWKTVRCNIYHIVFLFTAKIKLFSFI